MDSFDQSFQSISENERFARMRLIWSDNVGPITYRHLLARYKSAEKALEALPDLAARGGSKRAIRVCPMSVVDKELQAIKAFGGRFLTLGEPDYPKALAATEDAAPVLAVKGHVHLLDKRSVAMVGARNASAVAKKLAYKIAGELGQAGYVVTSGLARGIDAAAHQASLTFGTIAVLGTGIDIKYPRENEDLHDAIADQGLLVSEHPMGTKPQASHFPRRNRIISGLSLGVLVVEAALRSGSLITARLAAEQGREVMAIPGSPLDPRARGANNLIRQGATLVEETEDILNVLETLNRLPISEPEPNLFDGLNIASGNAEYSSDDRHTVLHQLNLVPTEIDGLIRETGLSTGAVLSIILELELAGKIMRLPGNRVSLSDDTFL